jgi:hypothetical protein
MTVGLGIGCAPQHPAPSAKSADSAAGFVLRGENAVIWFDFSAQTTNAQPPHRLLGDEICRLTLESSTIEFFPEGTVLLLGSTESVRLMEDNPLWRLLPATSDKDAAAVMKLYATLYLVGGSIEKLPDALADYLDDPGPRRRDAIALARALCIAGGAKLPGFAHGGNFAVSFHLTNVGRDKLLEALEQIQQEQDATFVRAFRSPAPPLLRRRCTKKQFQSFLRDA